MIPHKKWNKLTCNNEITSILHGSSYRVDPTRNPNILDVAPSQNMLLPHHGQLKIRRRETSIS
jgi:predicted nucleotide-binding protein (sugar kinase/HSP70/actin superfamily)